MQLRWPRPCHSARGRAPCACRPGSPYPPPTRGRVTPPEPHTPSRPRSRRSRRGMHSDPRRRLAPRPTRGRGAHQPRPGRGAA
eukprot:scaffold2183_cov140-Isochrysis_galbana.AAC.12